MTDPVYAAAYTIYHDRGWSPIKLQARTKFPPPSGFTGHSGADPSYPDMMAWAEEEPHGNLAIRLPADVIGIDVDAYDNKTGAATIAEAEKRWGKLPYSPRSTSRHNGDYLSGIRLYRIPPGVELLDRIEFPELGIGDIEICQHHHRYVMCWPSWHPRGDIYLWLGIDDSRLQDPPAYPVDIPDLPERWLAALTKPTDHNTGLGDDPGYNVRGALTEGQPSHRVAWRLGEAIMACHGPGRHDHTRDNVLALLRYGKQGDPGVLPALKALQKAFVAAVGPDRPGGPAQASEEFRDFVNSRRVAELLAQPDHDEWVPPTEEPRENSDPNLDDQPAEDCPSLLTQRCHNGTWLDSQHFPPLEHAVDRIIPEGLGILVAPPKKGKSFLVANIGLAVAAGGTALGAINVTARPVLYLALEDGHRRLQARFRRILDDQLIPDAIDVVIEARPKEALLMIAEYLYLHAGAKPLIIVDTLGKIKPPKRPGEDAYLVDYQIGSTLKALADTVPGSTLLLVHHTRKAETIDFVDSISGTQGLAGSVDFVLVLDRKRHANDAILSVTGRDVIEAEYALTADDGILWRLDGTDLATARDNVEKRRAADKMGDRMMDVFRIVDAANDSVTATMVAEALDDMDGETAGKYLRRLAANDYIAKVGRGRYMKSVSQVSETPKNPGQGT
jgi:hypothetical protein